MMFSTKRTLGAPAECSDDAVPPRDPARSRPSGTLVLWSTIPQVEALLQAQPPYVNGIGDQSLCYPSPEALLP